MYRITILLVCILPLVSCKKTDSVNSGNGEEYFAFGTAQGMCQGDCAHFYCIDNGKAYADKMNYFYRTEDELQFTSTPLPDASYKKIKLLSATLPAYLAGHANQTFGCPDCRDQGLIYIETTMNGQRVHWMIDRDENGQPEEIRKYLQQLTEVMKQL